MSRRAAAFTQADVHRALKAARAAAPDQQFAVEIGGGVARIVPIDRALSAEALEAATGGSAQAPLADKPKWIF